MKEDMSLSNLGTVPLHAAKVPTNVFSSTLICILTLDYSKKIDFRYDSSQKADNKDADETARMHRLICALIVTNHRRQVFSVAVQLLYVSFYHEGLENKMRKFDYSEI